MLARVKNDLGVISLNKILLDQIVHQAMEPYRGHVWLANYKGASSDALIKVGGYEAIAEKTYRMNGDRLYMRLFVMVSFGKSISGVCRSIIDSIVRDVTESLGVEIDDIEIIVTAVVSKKTARRHITFSYKAISAAGASAK